MEVIWKRADLKLNLTLAVEKVGSDGVLENFESADEVWLFARNRTGRWRLPVSIADDGRVKAELNVLNVGMTAGVYSLKLVWAKNDDTDLEAKSAARLMSRLAGMGRCGCDTFVEPEIEHGGWKRADIGVCEVSNAFSLTASQDEASVTSAEVELAFSREAGVYGYDGLDAYERAVMLGKTTLSEEEWLEPYSDTSAAQKIIEELKAGYVTSVNGNAGDVVLNKDDIGLSHVDNTADASKSVARAVKDGDGNVITDTYATNKRLLAVKADILSDMDKADDALADKINKLTGLKSTNFKGIETSVSSLSVPSSYPAWCLVGSSLNALKLYVYRNNSEGWTSFDDSRTYDFTDYSEVKEDVAGLQAKDTEIEEEIVEAKALHAQSSQMMRCEDVKVTGKAINANGAEFDATEYLCLVFDVREGDVVSVPSVSKAGASSIVARLKKADGTTTDEIITADTDIDMFTISADGEMWVEYYRAAGASGMSVAGMTATRVTAADAQRDEHTYQRAAETAASYRISRSCEDIKQVGEALDLEGSVRESDEFTSLVLDVVEGDYVEFPKITEVGADSVVARIMDSSGSVIKQTIKSNDDARYIVASVSGELWIEYWAETGGMEMDWDGQYVARLSAKEWEIMQRITYMEETEETKVYNLSNLIVKGKAFFNASGVVGNSADFSYFEIPVKKGYRVTAAGSSKVGSTNVTVWQMASSDDSVTSIQSAISSDQIEVTATAAGTLYFNYYFKAGDAATATETAGLTAMLQTISTTGGVPSAGRKVLWLGTSIPYGGGTASTSYPLMVKDLLNLNTLYNNSVPSSGIVLHSGYLASGRDGLDLSETIAEKEARYRAKVTDGTITEATLASWKGDSYEKLLMPYIDGTTASCDTIVIDHGFNDRAAIKEEIEAGVDLTSTDRTTFIGAFNYLLKKIYSVSPRIQVIVVGYFCKENLTLGLAGENYSCYGNYIDSMLQKICDYYNFTYLPAYEASQINQLNYLSMLVDGVHPHSDSTQAANLYIARYLANRLRGVL